MTDASPSLGSGACWIIALDASGLKRSLVLFICVCLQFLASEETSQSPPDTHTTQRLWRKGQLVRTGEERTDMPLLGIH